MPLEHWSEDIRDGVGKFLRAAGSDDISWEAVAVKCHQVQASLSPLVMYRKSEYLVPLVAYLYLRTLRVPVDKDVVIKEFGLTDRDFRGFMDSLRSYRSSRGSVPVMGGKLALTSHEFSRV